MILLTGATGFTGRYVTQVLLDRHMPFKCLIRDPAKSRILSEHGVPIIQGDVRDEQTLVAALEGCTGVINLVSFSEEHVPALVRSSQASGARRALFVGTTAMFTRIEAKSKEVRQRAEDEITKSGLEWTILRPTMIYGASGDRNMERLISVLRKYPAHPILGKGTCLLQPIHVRDLARAIVDAFSSPKAIRRAFNLSGKNAVSYRQVVEQVTRLLGKKVWKFSLPLWMAILAVEIARRLPGLPRIKAEQVRRLNEDKAFSHQEAADTWGFDPVDFETGICLELEDLGIARR